MISSTYSYTYTVVDVRRVLDCFAADYDMIAQATGLETQDRVADTVHDVKLLAEMGYLARADIVLLDIHGAVIRAARYTVCPAASLWTMQRPGNNLWPRIPNGRLVVVVSYPQKWQRLGDEQQRAFQRSLRIPWSPSSIDLSYPGLSGWLDRRYASGAYGMEKIIYC